MTAFDFFVVEKVLEVSNTFFVKEMILYFQYAEKAEKTTDEVRPGN